MTERTAGDHNPTAPLQFQIPQETYEVLKSLENGRLGNAYSKRVVRVSSSLDNLPGMAGENVDLSGDKLYVYMRIRQANRFVEDDYAFTINPEGTVVNLKSWQYGGHKDKKDLEPPSPELFMRELQAAQKIQPTLKR